MLKFFNALFTPDQQKILNDKYIISINEYIYDIPSFEIYSQLQKDFTEIVLLNKFNNQNDTHSDSHSDKSRDDEVPKYRVSFKNNEKTDISISVTNREYIVQLLENINLNILNNKVNTLNLRS
jgi:hypothetical protein